MEEEKITSSQVCHVRVPVLLMSGFPLPSVAGHVYSYPGEKSLQVYSQSRRCCWPPPLRCAQCDPAVVLVW